MNYADGAGARAGVAAAAGRVSIPPVGTVQFQIAIVLGEPRLQRIQRSARVMPPMCAEVETPFPYGRFNGAILIQSQASLQVPPDVCQICNNWLLRWNGKRIETLRIVVERKRSESSEHRLILFLSDFGRICIRRHFGQVNYLQVQLG